MTRLLAYLPRGNTLDDRSWHRRHVFLQALLPVSYTHLTLPTNREV